MPKLKIRNSIKKRFKVTKNGKILRRQSFRRHLKESKSKKRLRNLKKQVPDNEIYARKIRKAMGVTRRTK
jgi:large subunit ribosomal protein L35